MSQPLWAWDELVAISGGQPEGIPDSAIIGFSIDTRTLIPGDVFVALEDNRDGHDFVSAAFERRAAAAIVSLAYTRKPSDGALLRTVDPLTALGLIAIAARARTAARIVAVTGSVGKTGTKDMLRLCLSPFGKTHAPEKSFNNHWGVPLTLARMPADSKFAVFEIGMNHPGEITPLSRMVRPHVALITTVERVHLAQFASVEGIADAKAEIFAGLEPGGVAVLNLDNPHFERLAESARRSGAAIMSFGTEANADMRLESISAHPDGSHLVLSARGRRITCALKAPGAHLAMNAAGTLAAAQALGCDPTVAAGALAAYRPAAGRGARLALRAPDGPVLILDESYNANPASMRAGLAALALVPRDAYPRRIAVMGDMLELGHASAELHLGLKEAVDASGADLVVGCGAMTKLLLGSLSSPQQTYWAETSAELEGFLTSVVRGGDAVMIKGSLGSRMGPLVTALSNRFADR